MAGQFGGARSVLGPKHLIWCLMAFVLFWPGSSHANDERKAAKVISKFDRNGDGRLARDEWLKRDGSFDKIDRDGDGFLSAGDFIEHWAAKQSGTAGSQRGSASLPEHAAIPIIDAHSQVDCNVSEELVVGQLEKLGIARVLISIRGCKGRSSKDLEAGIVAWSMRHPDKISPLLSTKVDGWSFDPIPEKAGGVRAFLDRADRQEFVGMGEVLVQHAAHDHARLRYPELALPLGDRRIETAIDLARSRGWPVTLHLELNDNEAASAQTLAGLAALLRRHPETPFLLIHMGQATPDEAQALLQAHVNIHFLTTHADSFTAYLLDKKKGGGHSQTGWINLFEAGCDLHECPAAWNPQWRDLIVRFPDRFVLAFENVFPAHWEKPYEIRVGIWRRALALLPDDVAHALAHGNAERLWKLPAAR